MRRIMRAVSNRDGYVLVAAVVIALVVSGFAIVGIQNSSRNLTANRNLVSRNRAFYSADGLITMMVQDIMDGDYRKYLLCRGLATTSPVGTLSPPGEYKHVNPFRDTVLAAGGGIGGTSDLGFYYAYTTLKGDLDLKVKVLSVQNAAGPGKAGLMIRPSLAQNSKFAFMGVSPTATPWRAVFVYRTANGGASAQTGAATAFPRWMRLQRQGTQVRGYQSTDGVTWTAVSNWIDCDLGPAVYVGLAVTSANAGVVCKATFDSLDLDRGSGTYAMGDISVAYTLDKASDGGYDLVANASKLDTQGKTVFSMPLKQHFARKAAARPDSGYLHYVIYDYKSDGTNPNFQNCEIEETHLGLVDSVLSLDRKPRFRRDFAAKRRGGRASLRWHDNCTQQLRLDQEPSVWARACCVNRLNEWFRVSGGRVGTKDTCDTSYSFVQDPFQKSKWRWKRNSDGSDLVFDAVANAHRGANFNASDPMANYIVYDSVKLVNSSDKSADFPSGKCGDKEKMYSRSYVSYVPVLVRRGFVNDRYHGQVADDDDSCKTLTMCQNLGHLAAANPDSNHSWALEIHQEFIYHEGEDRWFWYEGQDNIWVFVNGKLATEVNMDDNEGYVWLDSIKTSHNLQDGQTFTLDFFQVNRWGQAWEFQIFSDLDFFSVNKPQSNWRRDYGRLD